MSKDPFIAIIDFGSLALRLKIFETFPNRKPKEVESVRTYFSFGAKTYRDGYVTAEQIAEFCEILEGYRLKMKEYALAKAVCIATSSFREARNKDFLVEQIRLRTDFKVVVIDNAQERYYHNLAVKENQPDFVDIIQNGTMMLDIGAGSIQATVYDKSEFIFSQNMLLGSLRVSELLSDLERKTTHYTEVLEEFISQDLDDYHSVEPKGISYKEFIAFGGDIGFIKTLAGLSSRAYCFLTKKQFLDVYDLLLRTKSTDLALTHNVPSLNASLLLPTAILIKKMLDYTGLDGVHLPAASLSDGVAYHLAYDSWGFQLKQDPELDLIAAARHIAKRYRSDKKHTENVEKHALAIFDACVKYHGMGSQERLLLRIAVILHEVGKYIHVSKHGSRSYHIINTTELIGLNENEREVVACCARFYAKPIMFSDRFYTYLPSDTKMLVSKLTAILRIADAMDASHRQKIRSTSITATTDSLTICCDSAYDLTFEEWAFDQKRELYSQVFGVAPSLRLRRPTK